MAWRGPVAAGSRNGVSWASALAIRSVYVLARDLRHSDLAVSDWLNRCRDLASGAFEHDVAISFAGADRTVAESISKIVKQAGYRVFYDRDYQHVLLGEDLATYLQEVYFRKSRFAIVVVSRAFLDSRWAGNWEWRAVLARMQSQHAGYVLPYLLEDVVVPGLNPTIGYVSHRDYAPQDFAALVIRKLRSGRTV
jgi:hypothetical protein